MTTLLDAFEVATGDDAVIRQALSWAWTEFENAVQMGAALSAGADYLVTRNPRGFRSSPVPVVEPAAFLAILSAT